jgi:hypothetical protein
VTRSVREKRVQNVARAFFIEINTYIPFSVEKANPKIWAPSVIKKLPKEKNHPKGEI